MKILKWILYCPFVIFLTLLSFLLSPFLSLYSVLTKRNILPGKWQWWSTVDNTLDGGFDQESYPLSRKGNLFWLWWYRMFWICRNPAYGWETIPFGCEYSEILNIKEVGNDEEQSTTYYFAKNKEGYWCLRGMLRFSKLGIRFGFGWKITQPFNVITQPSSKRCQYVCSLAFRLFKQ